MNFPTTTEEFLKTFAHGKEPTSEDREYAEALGKLSEQFASLQEYCIKNRVSISAAFREAFFTLHPMDSTNENEK